MSKTVKELLSDPLKGTNRTQGALCYLFRHVLLWRRVNQFTWDRRAKLFLEKPHNRKNADKGNLNKALTQDDFTWSNFKKAIDFLNPVSATFTVSLTWSSGRVSEYSIIIDPAEDESDPQINTFEGSERSDVFEDQHRPTSTLARLFRHIVASEQIDLKRWNALLEEHVKNPMNGVAQNRRERSTAISTYNRELLEKRMSWNVFRRGILILNPAKEQYKLELKWSKEPDDVSVHIATIPPRQC